MAKLNAGLDESTQIIAVGEEFHLTGGVTEGWTDPFVGLPGMGGGLHTATNVNCEMWGQFVIDDRGLLWIVCRQCNLYHPYIDRARYPMSFKVARHPWNWLPYADTDQPYCNDFWPSGIVVDNTGAPSDPGEWGWAQDRGKKIYMTEEDARAGKHVKASDGWMWVGYINSEIKYYDGRYHIWIGGRAWYDREDDPINPKPREFKFTYSEIPFYYFPCSVARKDKENFISCNNKGAFKVARADGKAFEECKNKIDTPETSPGNEDQGRIIRADGGDWTKIRKG